MTSIRRFLTILAAFGATAVVLPAAASAAPSRAELEQSVIRLEEALARAEARLNALEGSGPSASSVQQRLDSIQSELVRVVGELEEAQFRNARLQNDLRALRREIQLRDGEIAERLGLEPAFPNIEDFASSSGGFSGSGAPGVAGGVPSGPGAGQQSGFGAPSTTGPGFEAPLGEPATGSTGPAETDPGFFGEDPFADARSANVGTLGAPLEVPDTAPDALAFAKSLLMDGRFGDADTALAEIGANFPGTPEAAEALFWRGEAQGTAHNYNAAKEFYINSLQADPTGPRAADAMVALAASLQAMGVNAEACNVLEAFPSQFPDANLPLRQKADRVRQDASCR